MTRTTRVRRAAVALTFVFALAAPVAAQQEAEFENLKILPKNISRPELLSIMGGFTRALGVRCGYCHVSEQENPTAKNRFALDDKPQKAKARIMMTMTHDLNEKYLTQLATREKPAIDVQCVTCHHGVSEPRQLQDILTQKYEEGGVDSTLARYRTLRERYYGRASYDFGELPLAEAGTNLLKSGHGDDGVQLLAYNVEMNPKSAFAKRQHAAIAILNAYQTQGKDAGAAKYREMLALYSKDVVSEELLNDVGYRLIDAGQIGPAVAAFELNVSEHPQSSNAYDSVGEGYVKLHQRKQAIAAFNKALALDAGNKDAQHWLDELKRDPKLGK